MIGRILLALLIGVVVAGILGLALAVYGSRDLGPDYLEPRYTDRTSRFVEVDAVRFHVREAGDPDGDAPTLVLIHGFGAHLQTWDVWTEALADRFHIIRFDLPGHGLTGPDPSGMYTNERTLELIVGLLDSLDVERSVMIGNSLGGLMAWRFAAAYPDRVAAQVLIAPGGMPPPRTESGEEPEVPGWFGLIRYIFPKALIRATLEQLYGDKTRLTDEIVTRYHELIRRRGNRDALLSRMRGFAVEDPEEVLRGIETPSLILWGSDDRLLPVEQAALFDRYLPDSRLEILPNVGHMPMEEAPAASLAVFRTFWADLMARAPAPEPDAPAAEPVEEPSEPQDSGDAEPAPDTDDDGGTPDR